MRSCFYFVQCPLSGSVKFLLIVFCLLLILRPRGGKDYGVGEKLEQKRSDLHGRVKIDIYAQLKWNLRKGKITKGVKRKRENIEA